MPGYEELLKEIEELEHQPEKVGVSSVDISSLFNDGRAGVAPDYRKMLDIVDSFESQLRNIIGRQQVKAPKQAQAAAPEQAETYWVPETHLITPPQAVQESVPMHEELKKVVVELPKAAPKIEAVRVKPSGKNEAVLPSLQISDQLHELERIISVLEEKTLTKEQLKVVRIELLGLDKHVREMKKELRKEGRSLNQLDQAICDTRDKRLSEALELLKG